MVKLSMVPEEASAPDPSMGVAVEARSKVMDSEDEGIFLFGSSKQKLVTISDENKTNVNTLFASSEDKSVVPETWNSVPRIRSALPRQCSKDLIKDVIITGEEIKRWATIYAKTDADIIVRMDRHKSKGCRAHKRTRKQRRISKLNR